MPSILDHYNKLHTAYLHANGEQGTEALLQRLNINGKQKILEIGFGTGATLVKLKSRFPYLLLSGIEADQTMLETAQRRIRFCNLKNKIALLHIQNKDQILANSIDVVYAESVLGIQAFQTLKDTLNFIHRVLKPGGILAVNESIWLESTTESEITDVNDRCLTTFGIIQCNSIFAGKKASIDFFENQGFESTFFEKMEPVHSNRVIRKNYREYLSALFSLIGKLRLFYNPRLKKANDGLVAEVEKIFTEPKAYLAGTIMVFRKR